jgi:tRNA U38,U39,U40 pseudouridine synthase TruA
MQAVIESRDRSRGGVTAPPEGLSLERVYYDGEDLHEWRARAPGRGR